MYPLRRWFNQNRKKIVVVIMAIVFVIILVQVTNQLLIQQKEQKVNSVVSNNEQKENNLPKTSIITGETIDEKATQTNVKSISDFIGFCNDGKKEEAYAMLTQECKEELFPTQEEFIKGYYEVIFTERRSYKIENYKNSSRAYTYEVSLYSDILSTGKLSNNTGYTDYITIDTWSEEGKININSFIYKANLEAEQEEQGIKVRVLSRNIYKDYEIYEIKIENTTDKTILLDTRKKSRTIYATGTDNATYSAFKNEIAGSLYELDAGYSRMYTIKFNKIYNPGTRLKDITFSDIVGDYEKYKQEPETLTQRIIISVKI